jgi:protein-S-isoprenylcysteine O-methyltransferase Ste14
MISNYLEFFYAMFLIFGMIIMIKSRRNKIHTKLDSLDRIFSYFIDIGMFYLPYIYLLTHFLDWIFPYYNIGILDFADYFLPTWVAWPGIGFFISSLWLLWKSHTDLDSNFSPALEIKEEHKLVTQGVYSYIRHPIYTAFCLWAIAQVLLLQNLIVGPAFLVVIILFYIYRVPKEEQMMIEQFGEEYRSYMNQTGRFIPRFWR